MNVSILGKGTFGVAVGSILSHNGHQPEYADLGIPLTRPADVLFITVPTQAIRSAINDNRSAVTDSTIIVSCSKGIEENTHLLPRQIISDLGLQNPYYSLLGPSFAYDIVAKHPTIVSLGYEDDTHIARLLELLQTQYFRVHPEKGCRMLELSGALKNVYAVICGYAEGLGYGPNTRAALVVLALKELKTLAQAQGFKHHDVLSPGVMGDMVLTCTSNQSRNYQFGHALAQSADAATLAKESNTTEGYYTAHSVVALMKQTGIEMPLAQLTADLIGSPGPGNPEKFRAFIARC